MHMHFHGGGSPRQIGHPRDCVRAQPRAGAVQVNKLEFLPYHFLLASVGNAGYLKYQASTPFPQSHRTAPHP